MGFKKVFLACGLSAACSAFAAQYEAEDAAITKDAAVASNAEASGGKYVKMNGGDITFSKVTAEKAGQYTIVIHYMNNYGGDKINNVGAGSNSSQVSFPVTDKGKFVDVETVLSLAAGETKTVTLEIPVKDLRYWNVDKNAWDLEHGKLVLLLGAASDDIRQQAEVTI